jgi:hypothetical protein
MGLAFWGSGGRYDFTLILREGPKELVRLGLENLGPAAVPGYTDYSIQIASDRDGNINLRQLGMISYPDEGFSPIGLVRQALNTLTEEDLRIE